MHCAMDRSMLVGGSPTRPYKNALTLRTLPLTFIRDSFRLFRKRKATALCYMQIEKGTDYGAW